MPGRSLRFVALAFTASLAPLGSARAVPQDEKLVEVSGTVVVEDGKGGTVDDESGTIVVSVHEDNGWRPQNVFLIEGEWKTKVPAKCQLSFEVFKLDGGIAAWLLEGEKELPAGKRRFDHEGPREQGLPIPKDHRIAVRARLRSDGACSRKQKMMRSALRRQPNPSCSERRSIRSPTVHVRTSSCQPWCAAPDLRLLARLAVRSRRRCAPAAAE
jgi:hypothetical protein